MWLRRFIVSQFAHPRGLFGRLVGHVLASRSSNRRRNEWTVDLLELESHHRVLEFGCGPGVALARCAPRAGFVLGTDQSEIMVEQARRRLAHGIATRRAEVRCLPFEAHDAALGSFDRIYSLNVIQFLPDMEDVFRRIRGLLSPGGRVATTYQPRTRNPTRADALAMADRIEAAMTAAGFGAIARCELALDPPAVCVIGERG